MASGDPSKQQGSWYSPSRLVSGLKNTASTVYSSFGLGDFGEEEEPSMAEKKGEERLNKHRNRRVVYHTQSVASEELLDDCMKESKIDDLLSNNKELSHELKKRHQQILALREEADVIQRRNLTLELTKKELESKIQALDNRVAQMSKLRQGRGGIEEDQGNIAKLLEHMKEQSRVIMSLRKDQEQRDVEASEDKGKIHELEEEILRLQEDFQSAQESMEQLKEQNKKLLSGRYIPQAEITEDNMTDAVKLNTQQEVASLQQVVQPLQEENEKLRSELEALKIERNKLNKIKEKYFSLVSERAVIYQRLNEAESQNKVSDEQTAPLVGPDVEMSLVAADVNIHQELGGLSMETLLRDKDMEISDLKAKLEHALSRAMSKDQLEEVEMSLREEHVDLKKATETLNSRFKSIRKELTRVQSQNSDVSMENEGLLRDITTLEEENLQLQSAVTKYKMKSEYWQQRCENEDIECRIAAQTAELTISMLQVDLNELERRLFRKENEVQTVKDCRKLEEQLRIYQEERDQQDEQIAQLVAIKANLSNALSCYDSYAHDLGEFKQQSQQFKKALSMKISEVEHLKKEKMALQKEIKSLKDEVDIRKAEVVKERQQTKFWELQFNETHEKWTIKQRDYEMDISALSDQVESFRTTVEKLDLLIAQTESKYDAKLKMTESRLLKEKQDHEQTRKDLNRVTEQLQSTQQNYNMTVAKASEIHEELKEKVAALLADKSQLQEDLMQLKKEMQVKQKQYEHEKMTSEKNVKQLCEYVEDLQQTVSRMNREKELLDGEIDKMKISFQEERQHLTSVQRNLEVIVQETKKQYDKEKEQWIHQLKSLDLLRKTIESQLDEEKVRAEERSENISRLSRDVVTKEQAIKKYEQEMLHLQECLQSHKSDSLKNYEIKEVHCIKSKINAGSYGSISLVNVNGMLCIQKCLHDILVGLNGTEAVSEDQQRSISEKFYEECQLLWKMRHPNIVQFMGIHYNGEVGEIHKMSLIMEYLPSNVEDCITKCSQTSYSIPWSIKISVFRDVTYGLSHLHANGIIHRDLSAANILLTYSMGAKIADLGVSKLVSPSCTTKFTAAPGANYIMPPEALEENPQYDDKLDIFSLGIFILYLTLQKEPNPQNATLKTEHLEKKQIEIGRRLSHIDLLEKENSNLANVVKEALQDNPKSRPSAASLCTPMNTFFKEVKDKLYPHLMDFIESIGNDILVSYKYLIFFNFILTNK